MTPRAAVGRARARCLGATAAEQHPRPFLVRHRRRGRAWPLCQPEPIQSWWSRRWHRPKALSCRSSRPRLHFAHCVCLRHDADLPRPARPPAQHSPAQRGLASGPFAELVRSACLLRAAVRPSSRQGCDTVPGGGGGGSGEGPGLFVAPAGQASRSVQGSPDCSAAAAWGAPSVWAWRRWLQSSSSPKRRIPWAQQANGAAASSLVPRASCLVPRASCSLAQSASWALRCDSAWWQY